MVDDRGDALGKGQPIEQRQGRPPRVTAHHHLLVAAVLTDDVDIGQEATHRVRASDRRTARSALVVTVHGDDVIDHGCDGTEVVPQSGPTVAEDQGWSAPGRLDVEVGDGAHSRSSGPGTFSSGTSKAAGGTRN